MPRNPVANAGRPIVHGPVIPNTRQGDEAGRTRAGVEPTNGLPRRPSQQISEAVLGRRQTKFEQWSHAVAGHRSGVPEQIAYGLGWAASRTAMPGLARKLAEILQVTSEQGIGRLESTLVACAGFIALNLDFERPLQAAAARAIPLSALARADRQQHEAGFDRFLEVVTRLQERLMYVGNPEFLGDHFHELHERLWTMANGDFDTSLKTAVELSRLASMNDALRHRPLATGEALEAPRFLAHRSTNRDHVIRLLRRLAAVGGLLEPEELAVAEMEARRMAWQGNPYPCVLDTPSGPTWAAIMQPLHPTALATLRARDATEVLFERLGKAELVYGTAYRDCVQAFQSTGAPPTDQQHGDLRLSRVFAACARNDATQQKLAELDELPEAAAIGAACEDLLRHAPPPEQWRLSNRMLMSIAADTELWRQLVDRNAATAQRAVHGLLASKLGAMAVPIADPGQDDERPWQEWESVATGAIAHIEAMSWSSERDTSRAERAVAALRATLASVAPGQSQISAPSLVRRSLPGRRAPRSLAGVLARPAAFATFPPRAAFGRLMSLEIEEGTSAHSQALNTLETEPMGSREPVHASPEGRTLMAHLASRSDEDDAADIRSCDLAYRSLLDEGVSEEYLLDELPLVFELLETTRLVRKEIGPPEGPSVEAIEALPDGAKVLMALPGLVARYPAEARQKFAVDLELHLGLLMPHLSKLVGTDRAAAFEGAAFLAGESRFKRHFPPTADAAGNTVKDDRLDRDEQAGNALSLVVELATAEGGALLGANDARKVQLMIGLRHLPRHELQAFNALPGPARFMAQENLPEAPRPSGEPTPASTDYWLAAMGQMSGVDSPMHPNEYAFEIAMGALRTAGVADLERCGEVMRACLDLPDDEPVAFPKPTLTAAADGPSGHQPPELQP